MNKQELIDILENLECSTESLSYDNGYEQGVYDSLSHVILLDEPKKVVVPPMIAKFIRESDDPIYEICTWADYYGNDGRTCEDCKLSAVINWYGKNSNEFYRAVINGYEVKEEPIIHELKILPEYFEAVVSGNKRFEIRKNDRNYKKGDILRLNEYQDGQYTGDVHVAEITYITDYAQQDGYVVLGIK
ncbi:DUF3850 domain-containing protein [Enterococcus faecalis]|nr:DUF3850 domain-containing protein [Enterococcus faecalis]